ncbi:MAG TPA: hypothetical protein VF939_12355 [Puia sp.]
MKKSRIFMAAGTLALVVSAIFATKANKKFANLYSGTLYYGTNKTTAVAKADAGCTTSPVLYSVKASSPNGAVVPFFTSKIAIGYNASVGYFTLYN